MSLKDVLPWIVALSGSWAWYPLFRIITDYTFAPPINIILYRFAVSVPQVGI